jgi:hypothetical protein
VIDLDLGVVAPSEAGVKVPEAISGSIPLYFVQHQRLFIVTYAESVFKPYFFSTFLGTL